MSAAERPLLELLREGGAEAVLLAVAEELVRRGARALFLPPHRAGGNYALLFDAVGPYPPPWIFVFEEPTAEALLAKVLADKVLEDPATPLNVNNPTL